MSHPARGAWIETSGAVGFAPGAESHPARGAWIETGAVGVRRDYRVVAPRARIELLDLAGRA